MRIEILQGMTPVVIANATRVLVCSDDGTPLSVSAEWMPAQVHTAHAGEGGEFTKMLRDLGVNRSIIVSGFQPKPVAEVFSR